MFRIIILSLVLTGLFYQNGFTIDDPFVIRNEPLNIISPLTELGIGLYSALADIVPFDLRQSNPKAPGDYFRYPLGADSVTLSSDDKIEIYSLLKSYISKACYDSTILDNIAGYQYRLHNENANRRDYFISYSKGDTIYVISGWLGKFISFYRAVPGSKQYSIKELQDEAQLLAPSYLNASADSFKINPKGPYFLEHVNIKDKMRIRGYIIKEQISIDKKTGYPVYKPYSLIEITKFQDKDVIP